MPENTTTGTKVEQQPGYTFLSSVVGWLVVWGVLIAMAQFSDTAQLAVLFAYLILVTALLAYGQEAFANLGHVIGTGQWFSFNPGEAGNAPDSGGGGGSGGSHKPM